jgi:hypothetical protein
LLYSVSMSTSWRATIDFFLLHFFKKELLPKKNKIIRRCRGYTRVTGGNTHHCTTTTKHIHNI